MKKISNPPTSIIFDFDNTLVDVWPIMEFCIHKTFKKMNVTNKIDSEKISIEKSLREYFPKIFGEKWKNAQKIYRECYLNNSKTLKALEGAEETLKFLKEKKIFTCIVSNKDCFILRNEITKLLSWDKYFNSAVGADDAEEDKPSIKPVKLAFKGKENLLDENSWLVGDTLTDMECARNIGCKSILFGANPARKIFEEAPPDFYAKNHFEFLEFLKEYL